MIVTILGGTGTLGTNVVPILLKDPQVQRIRVLSRNEHRQAELADEWAGKPIDFLVGDIRDRERVERAVDGAHWVFHFAATKRVEKCEYDPEEAVKTNVLGTLNIIHACRKSDTVQKAIYTSTDKAVSPINTYGMSKALAEKLWIQGNVGNHFVRFSACRYGNVFGSNGSVIKKWANGTVKVTDENMTRFFISKTAAADFVVSSMYEMDGGEVFIPRMRSTRMGDLAALYGPYEVIGARPGEKTHERLIAEEEVELTTETGRCYIRWPEMNLYPVRRHGDPISGVICSASAEKFTEDELKCLIQSS